MRLSDFNSRTKGNAVISLLIFACLFIGSVTHYSVGLILIAIIVILLTLHNFGFFRATSPQTIEDSKKESAFRKRVKKESKLFKKHFKRCAGLNPGDKVPFFWVNETVQGTIKSNVPLMKFVILTFYERRTKEVILQEIPYKYILLPDSPALQDLTLITEKWEVP